MNGRSFALVFFLTMNRSLVTGPQGFVNPDLTRRGRPLCSMAIVGHAFTPVPRGFAQVEEGIREDVVVAEERIVKRTAGCCGLTLVGLLFVKWLSQCPI